MMESKHDKFMRMKAGRLPKAVKAIELLANLAGRDYEYRPDEAENLIWHLDKAVEVVAEAFGIASVDPAPEPEPEPEPEPAPVAGYDAPAYGGSEWALVSQALEELNNGCHGSARVSRIKALQH